MEILFNDQTEKTNCTVNVISNHIIELVCPTVNLSGFKIFFNDILINDCSDYKTLYEQGENSYKLSNDGSVKEDKDYHIDDYAGCFTEQDLINADIYMQIAQLQMAGGFPMSMATVSPRYNLLKRYYDMGIYNDENMKIFVACGWLTADEYREITGSIYVA